MAERYVERVVWLTVLYSFALFNWFLYLGLAFKSGSFFKRRTEQDKLQFSIARDRFWNLAKSPIPGYVHRFYITRSGSQIHYIVNSDLTTIHGTSKNLVVLLHGWPDSSMMWRELLSTEGGENLTKNAIMVLLDLPGFGGSSSLTHYGPEEVLESLTEFIVAMREKYMDVAGKSKAYIVGHDWGCALSYRLAAEAPVLADRFILSNGPLVELGLANKDRIISSSSKIFKQFYQHPQTNFACLSKSYRTLKPLLYQILLFGYIAVFQLPSFMVKYLGVGGNFSFLRGATGSAYGKDRSEYRPMDCLACSLGPGVEEWSSKIPGEKTNSYDESVLKRAQSAGLAFYMSTSYYRDGVATQPWSKSLETIADLHNIENMPQANGSARRRHSSSASSPLFGGHFRGALRAPSTILWGQKDIACTQAICLDGIGDYLARDSQVILLPRTGHWTAVEKESRVALARVINRYACGNGDPEFGEIVNVVKASYPDAVLMVKR